MRYIPTYIFPTREEAEEAAFTPEFMYLEIAGREHARAEAAEANAAWLTGAHQERGQKVSELQAECDKWIERYRAALADRDAAVARNGAAEARLAAAAERQQTAEADALRAEMAEARAERLEALGQDLHWEAQQYLYRIDAAEAENERLAEVLRGIQGMAAEELRTEELRPSTLMWQIEADARATLAASPGPAAGEAGEVAE